MRGTMMQTLLTIDDLTEKDFHRIRFQHKVYLSNSSNPRLDLEEYIRYEINQYNFGLETVILRDIFEEVFEPVAYVPEPVKPVITEKVSNVGKKIMIEFIDDQVIKYTLVANSSEIDPDHNKISIHSDLGKIIQYASQGDVLETDLGPIRIVEIQNVL